MSSISSAEFAAAKGVLKTSLHDLWTIIKDRDANTHEVAFRRGRGFDPSAVSRLILGRQVMARDVHDRYCDDMRILAGWNGGRAVPAADGPYGWVQLSARRRRSYTHFDDPSLNADPALNLIIKEGPDLEASDCELYAVPALHGPDGWRGDEAIQIIDTDEEANGALQPATPEEVLALDAVVRSIRDVVDAPVS